MTTNNGGFGGVSLLGGLLNIGTKDARAGAGIFSKSEIKIVEEYGTALKTTTDFATDYNSLIEKLQPNTRKFVQEQLQAGRSIEEVSAAMQQGATSASLMASATKILNVALTGIAIGLVTAGIQLAVKAVSDFIHREEILAEKAQEARDAIDDLKSSFDNLSKSTEDIKQKYADLAQGVKGLGTAFQSQGSLSNDEYAEFLDLSNQLSELYPSLTKGYDENGNAILNLSGSVNTIVASLDQLIDRQRVIAKEEIDTKMADVWVDYVRKANTARAELDKGTDYGYQEALQRRLELLDQLSGTTHISLWGDNAGSGDWEKMDIVLSILDEIGVKAEDIQTRTEDGWYTWNLEADNLADKFATHLQNQISDYKNAIQSAQNDLDQINAYMRSQLQFSIAGNLSFMNLDKDLQSAVYGSLMDLDISKLPANVSNWDELAAWYEDNIVLALSKIDDEKIQKQIAKLIAGDGSVEELQEIYNEIYNYLTEQKGMSPDDALPIYFQSVVIDSVNNTPKQQAYNKLFGGIDWSGESADEAKQQQDSLREWVNSQFDDETIQLIIDADTAPLSSAKSDILAWVEQLKASNESLDQSIQATITDAVTTFNTQLKPQFDQLATAYDQIFNNESGFQAGLGSIDIAWFEGIRSTFGELQEDLNVDFDTSNIDAFFDAIQNGGEITEEVAHEAFNDLATAYFYSTEALEGLNEETAKSIQQMMEQMGVVNAEKIVQHYQDLDGSIEAFQDNLQFLNDRLEEGAELTDIMAESTENFANVIEKASSVNTELGITVQDVINADEQELQAIYNKIQGYYDEIGATAAVRIASFELALQELEEASVNLSPENKIAALSSLASAYLSAGEAAAFSAQMESYEAGLKYGTQSDRDAINKALSDTQGLVNRVTAQIKDVQVSFTPKITTSGSGSSGGGSSAASDAGKDAADEYKEAFENELSTLQFLRDNDFISEKEYLDQLRLLIEKYYSDISQYPQEYYEQIHDYLDDLKSYYEKAIYAATGLLDKEIDKYEKLEEQEKKVYETEKEANNARIKDLNKANKLLDKRIKALEKEQDAIRENDIKPLENEIANRQAVVDQLNDELSLMEKMNQQRQQSLDLQKAEYEYQRSLYQRVNLIYQEGPEGRGQLVYRPSEDNIKSAKESLDNIQYEIRLQAKKDEIELVEKQIEDLEDQIKKYEDQISAIDDIIDGLNKEKEANSEIIEGIEEQNEALDESIEKVETYYQKLIEGVEAYKEAWSALSDIEANAENIAILRSLGYDPEEIIGLDEATLESFKSNFMSILGSTYAENEEMMRALQEQVGTGIGNYMTATVPLFSALNQLDLSSIASGIESSKEGVYAINDGFSVTAALLQTFPEIATAIFTENDDSVMNTGLTAVNEIDAAANNSIDVISDRLSGINSSIESAISKAEKLAAKLREVGTAGSSGSAAGHAEGTVGKAYASGYNGLLSSEKNALRSEYGQPELTVYPNGNYEITTTPTISNLPKGTVIFNEEQTNRILSGGKAYASGTTGRYLPIEQAMPDKAAMFAQIEANISKNLDKINANVYDIGANLKSIVQGTTNNISNNATNNVTFGDINVTCPGVTEAEVARNLGSAIKLSIDNTFFGMQQNAYQRAMKR